MKKNERDHKEKQAVEVIRMKELPLSERPYEKCVHYGPEVLSDSELLAAVIRTGSRGGCGSGRTCVVSFAGKASGRTVSHFHGAASGDTWHRYGKGSAVEMYGRIHEAHGAVQYAGREA